MHLHCCGRGQEGCIQVDYNEDSPSEEAVLDGFVKSPSTEKDQQEPIVKMIQPMEGTNDQTDPRSASPKSNPSGSCTTMAWTPEILERTSPLFKPWGISAPLYALGKSLRGRILEGSPVQAGHKSTRRHHDGCLLPGRRQHQVTSTEPNQPYGRKANQPYVSSMPSKPICICRMRVRCPANPPHFRLKKN
jgi:hypothetical protein